MISPNRRQPNLQQSPRSPPCAPAWAPLVADPFTLVTGLATPCALAITSLETAVR